MLNRDILIVIGTYMSNFDTIAKISIVKKPIVKKPPVKKTIVKVPPVKKARVNKETPTGTCTTPPTGTSTTPPTGTCTTPPTGTSTTPNRRRGAEPPTPTTPNRRRGAEPPTPTTPNRRRGAEPPTEPPTDWKFYIIYHTGCGATYAGVSPDPVRRLRMHNGEICGGAKYTTSKGPGWVHICLVSGFPTKQNSMQFEWAIKHVAPRNVGGLESRLRKLGILFRKEQWTSKSPLAQSVPLEIEWVGVGVPTPCDGVLVGVGMGGADADTSIDPTPTKYNVFGVELTIVGALPEYIREIIN